jgi:hypothetical protein
MVFREGVEKFEKKSIRQQMQPLILVNTSVWVTVSVQNIAARRAGAATELSVKLNSRNRK